MKAIAKDNQLSQLMTWVMSIPMMTGFSPKLYQQMTACFLEKKPGVLRINKMRTIWLIDCVFSSSCKILARRTYRAAVKHNQLAKEDFGGRKGISAAMQAVNLRISMDIPLQKRSPTTVTAVDLVSCYDRIIHAIASICLRRLGHRRGPVVCRFSTVQNLNVNVRTAFGDSTMTNNCDLWVLPVDRKPQGALQGSTDGPILWAIVSSPVLDRLRALGCGVAYKCSLSGESVQYVACAFVDDATHFQNSPTHDIDDVLARTQANQTMLEGLIKATGGAVNPQKTFWWLIDFQWTHGIWRLKTIAQNPAVIRTRDKHENVCDIPRKEVHQEERILGVFLAPKSSGETQTKVLRDKVAAWVAKIRQSKMSPGTAWAAMATRIVKSIEWPLVACTLSEKQLRYVISPLIRWGLRSIGVNARLNRDILFGSNKLLGLGFRCPFTSMGIARLQHLVSHCHKKELTGDLLRVSLQCLQLETGLPGNLFDWDHQDWAKIVTKTWMSETWRFASIKKIGVKSCGPELCPRRQNDQALMPSFLAAGYKKGQLLRYDGKHHRHYIY